MRLEEFTAVTSFCIFSDGIKWWPLVQERLNSDCFD
jgi:hypothetical protein